MSNTYDSLHRQCRTLENLFDTKLNSYSQLGASATRGGDIESSGSSSRWRDLELELDGLLEKLEELNGQLSDLSSQPDSTSPSMLRAIQRHREICTDNARELRRTKTNVHHAFDQANLLSGVRNDIEAYKSSAAETLLAERSGIDSSHRMLDDTLEQAYEIRSDFSRQGNTLGSVNARMANVISTMPGINNVISMIKTRRRRDAIIIGVVIGVCIILLFSYLGQ